MDPADPVSPGSASRESISHIRGRRDIIRNIYTPRCIDRIVQYTV